MLAETAELMDEEATKRSGLELRRRAEINFDGASAFGESGERPWQSTAMAEWERWQHSAAHTKNTSSRRRLPNMETSRRLVPMDCPPTQRYPQKPDLMNILPESIVKDRKKSANFDFERDRLH